LPRPRTVRTATTRPPPFNGNNLPKQPRSRRRAQPACTVCHARRATQEPVGTSKMVHSSVRFGGLQAACHGPGKGPISPAPARGIGRGRRSSSQAPVGTPGCSNHITGPRRRRNMPVPTRTRTDAMTGGHLLPYQHNGRPVGGAGHTGRCRVACPGHAIHRAIVAVVGRARSWCSRGRWVPTGCGQTTSRSAAGGCKTCHNVELRHRRTSKITTATSLSAAGFTAGASGQGQTLVTS